MTDEAELAALRERVAALEVRNAELAAQAWPRSHRKLRTTACIVLVAVGLLLAPVAAVGTWARMQLVDTDRFVSTFAPLASDPQVQAFVTDQVTDQLDATLDLDRRVSELFGQLQDGELPPRAAAALGLLEAPTVAGLQNLISATTQQLVASERFADLWAASLRLSHHRTTQVLDDDPGALARLSEDGVLSLRLEPVVAAVRALLADRGMPFLDGIAPADRGREIPILSADSLALVRAVYDVAVIGGYWLPWVVVILLIAGVLVAVSPRRALAGTATAAAVVFALMSLGIWIGRNVFLNAISPGELPRDVAGVIFDQVTGLMSSTIVALTVFGVLVAIGAWFAGPARPARALRGVCAAGFGRVRTALDAHGGATGRVGAVVERWRTTIVALAVAAGVVGLVVTRPVTVASVVWFVVALIVLVVAVELVRRPAPPAGPEEPETASPTAYDLQS
ncbi:hypothetical protein [Gordonia caeni]|uniref:Integral membrane protein n=1 Tax=Gordonia caeni TaxID=1007097 RepID=A0ABP7P1N6_9ACTN